MRWEAWTSSLQPTDPNGREAKLRLIFVHAKLKVDGTLDCRPPRKSYSSAFKRRPLIDRPQTGVDNATETLFAKFRNWQLHQASSSGYIGTAPRRIRGIYYRRDSVLGYRPLGKRSMNHVLQIKRRVWAAVSHRGESSPLTVPTRISRQLRCEGQIDALREEYSQAGCINIDDLYKTFLFLFEDRRLAPPGTAGAAKLLLL